MIDVKERSSVHRYCFEKFAIALWEDVPMNEYEGRMHKLVKRHKHYKYD